MRATLKYNANHKGFTPWHCELFIGRTCILQGNFDTPLEAMEWSAKWKIVA